MSIVNEGRLVAAGTGFTEFVHFRFSFVSLEGMGCLKGRRHFHGVKGLSISTDFGTDYVGVQ
jgi:hypothetical protein